MTVYRCFGVAGLGLALLIGAARGPGSRRVSGATAASPGTDSASTPFAVVLTAHGGEEIIARGSGFLIKGVRITPTSGSGYIEREVLFAIDQNRFRREMQDPAGLRKTIDLFDPAAGYSGRVIAMSDGGYTTTETEAAQARIGALRFSAEICGLLPLLREFAGSTATYSVGRTDKMLDEFHIVTPSGEWSVYSDSRHLISSVQRGHLAIRYSGYRQVENLKLPFIQRVYLGERLVYELYFATIDPAPTFNQGYFDLTSSN